MTSRICLSSFITTWELVAVKLERNCILAEIEVEIVGATCDFAHARSINPLLQY